MGQNYSTATYKKTYGTEYVRSYRNYRTNKALYEKSKKEYETISKKLNNKPYQQSEKGKYETVISKVNIPDTAKTSARPIQKQSTVIEMPPPYTAQNEFRQADYSKIDTNSLKHPIVSVGVGRYRNIYTDEIVDTEEARRILEYAGYKPKPVSNMGLFFFFVVVIAFLLKGVGPVALVIWGFISKNKSMTDYIKIIHANALVFQMPASEAEIQAYNGKGNLYITAGFIVGIIQLISFIYSTIA